MSEAILELRDVSKSFGAVPAVSNLSLAVRRGEIFTLLGPSGCGKTTTLRLIAGFERPSRGEIYYRGQCMVAVSRRVFVPPHKRNMGIVFQSYAVWPHMTVFDNVAYPLRLRRLKPAQVRERVAHVLALVGLDGLETRPAPLLSGGQQQRVALARALVYEPELLLLDEAFSNLDAKLREHMRVELKLLQQRLGITVLVVTHDQIEALNLSDRMAVINLGHVDQQGSPVDLYERPATPFVRDFLGKIVLLHGCVKEAGAEVVIQTDDGARLVCAASALTASVTTGQPVQLAIRPEDLLLRPQSQNGGQPNVLPGTIETLLFLGDRYEASISTTAGLRVLCYVGRGQNWERGQRVDLECPPERMTIWPVSRSS